MTPCEEHAWSIGDIGIYLPDGLIAALFDDVSTATRMVNEQLRYCEEHAKAWFAGTFATGSIVSLCCDDGTDAPGFRCIVGYSSFNIDCCGGKDMAAYANLRNVLRAETLPLLVPESRNLVRRCVVSAALVGAKAANNPF